MYKKFLFLDDVRNPYNNEDWDVVRSYDEFKAYIRERYSKDVTLPEGVSFDHDLAIEHMDNSMYSDDERYNKLYGTFKERTGLHCAVWLMEFCISRGLPFPEFNVHSMNPVGANNICNKIMSYNLIYFDNDDVLRPNPYPNKPF